MNYIFFRYGTLKPEVKKLKHGIIIYDSKVPDSFHRALAYKNQFSKEELWVVADEKESPLLLQSQPFQEIILLPEVKEKKKEILQHVTTPTKIRLLSEKYFQQQQEKQASTNSLKTLPLKTEVKQDSSVTFTPRKTKRKKKQLLFLLLGIGVVVLLGLMAIFLF